MSEELLARARNEDYERELRTLAVTEFAVAAAQLERAEARHAQARQRLGRLMPVRRIQAAD